MAVEGLDQLLRKMRAIPERVTDEIRKEMEGFAADIVRQMRSVAPRETGALAASIDWTWGAAPKGSMVIGSVDNGGKAASPRDLKITIFAGGKVGGMDAFYARFQEFGTRKMPANPFFFPVYRANRSRVKAGITRAAKRAVRNA